MAKGPDRPPNGDPGPSSPGYPPRAAPRLHAAGNSVLGFTPTLPLVKHHDLARDSQRPRSLNRAGLRAVALLLGG
jgi:hypothetical protein